VGEEDATAKMPGRGAGLRCGAVECVGRRVDVVGGGGGWEVAVGAKV
jgi:hypothetical protein